MTLLLAEDNLPQRRYLDELLRREFPAHGPVLAAADGEQALALAMSERPSLIVLDIQMPGLSGVKVARAVWRDLPKTRIVFWTQFPHAIYINEIRKLVKAVTPPPAYGFIHKNNTEDRLIRFLRAVLEDGADMIDPAFKDSFQQPLLTEFESEALYYLALGLSNWTIARRCSLSQRGVESRLTTLYEKLVPAAPLDSTLEAYERLAYNQRTRAFFEALKRGLVNKEELEATERNLESWLAADAQRFARESRSREGS
ncbi:MAG: response regulator transcription factor [Acidobacteria bacterium]|nr:response regulator transcription factor [Acidobacteriota bacterium]MCG3191316.1 hypothetical protein [Thermoanaerobaculia bacterium]MCK6682048.1 response regulator transcription factor [Thermoanaerobaculia bacterium]